MNSIFTRRSIRRFVVGKKIEEDKLLRILKAGMQAPSAHNTQPWEFLVLQDDETKEAVSNMSPYAKMAKSAGAVIVVLSNMDKAFKEPPFWHQDLSACTQNMLIQTVEEGLGGVWLGFYPDVKSEVLKKHFDLPENIVPFSVIALGYSEDENRFVDRFDETKIHFEKY